jgi:hypothetical protein
MKFSIKPAKSDGITPSKEARIHVEFTDTRCRFEAIFAGMSKVTSEIGGVLMTTGQEIRRIHSVVSFARGGIVDTGIVRLHAPDEAENDGKLPAYGWEINGELQIAFYEDELPLVEKADDFLFHWNTKKQ